MTTLVVGVLATRAGEQGAPARRVKTHPNYASSRPSDRRPHNASLAGSKLLRDKILKAVGSGIRTCTNFYSNPLLKEDLPRFLRKVTCDRVLATGLVEVFASSAVEILPPVRPNFGHLGVRGFGHLGGRGFDHLGGRVFGYQGRGAGGAGSSGQNPPKLCKWPTK